MDTDYQFVWIFLKDNISIGALFCLLLVILNVCVFAAADGRVTYIKSTMATFAIGFPIGILTVKKITFYNWSIFLLIAYSFSCLIIWAIAYILENEIGNKKLKVLKSKIGSGVFIDLFFIFIGALSTKVLTLIEFCENNLPPVTSG